MDRNVNMISEFAAGAGDLISHNHFPYGLEKKGELSVGTAWNKWFLKTIQEMTYRSECCACDMLFILTFIL